MYIKDLRRVVQENFKDISTIKENLSNTIDILEIAQGKSTTLKRVTITNLPTEKTWLFENEKADNIFITQGKKVEKTIIYLKENKLYIVMIELKSTMNCDNLKKTKTKLQDSLSFLSIFLLINQHREDEYRDLKISPIGILCFNQNNLLNPSSSFSDKEICKKIKKNIEEESNLNKKFTIELESLTLGNIKIPFRAFQNPNPEEEFFQINFNDLIN